MTPAPFQLMVSLVQALCIQASVLSIPLVQVCRSSMLNKHAASGDNNLACQGTPRQHRVLADKSALGSPK